MPQPIKLAVYPGEDPVTLACQGLSFEIGYTALRLIAIEVSIMAKQQMSEQTRFHVERFAQALTLLAEKAGKAYRKQTQEEEADCRQRYHETGFGCFIDDIPKEVPR